MNPGKWPERSDSHGFHDRTIGKATTGACRHERSFRPFVMETVDRRVEQPGAVRCEGIADAG